MLTYIAIIRDHSASMAGIAKGAMDDYNLTIQGIKDSQREGDLTFITVVECGVGHLAENRFAEIGVLVENVRPITSYSTSGSGTPLLDAVGNAITNLSEVEVHHKDAAFLVMVITDGYENRSKFFNTRTISEQIRSRQATDRWTFVFRGPKGSTKTFRDLGVAEGNIMEWEQTTADLARSTVVTTQGISNYFVARSAGKTSSTAFFANINVPKEQVKAAVADTTSNFYLLNVDYDSRIDDLVTSKFGSYQVGRGFYQLTKLEKAVQDYKEIALLDKTTRKIYSGTGNVRSLLGLPTYGSVKLVPGDHKNYDIFIQSTSVNRKLIGGTKMLYKKA